MVDLTGCDCRGLAAVTVDDGADTSARAGEPKCAGPRGGRSVRYEGVSAEWRTIYCSPEGAYPPDGGQLSVAPRKVVCCVVIVRVEPACILDELVLVSRSSSFAHRTESGVVSERD